MAYLRAKAFRSGLFCATSVAMILGGAAIAQTSAEASAPPAVADDGSSDIVVTAQRREERAQDVPISITAFSSDRLQQQGIAQSQDLQGAVPSLTVGTSGQGSREAQSFTIRGQGATLQASPGVVVYLNEVPLPSPISVNQRDSARVEKRGPSTTTMVPPSTAFTRSADFRTVARPAGQ